MSQQGLRPDFLGIGVPRACTTWLHNQLSEHPDVEMPTRRKELHFFTSNYPRGEGWYSASFDTPSRPPARVGEITPHYLYDDEARGRIRHFGGIDKFILCLREPVARLWSQYRYQSTMYGYPGSIEQFIEDRPDMVAQGFYARNLALWFDEFGEEQFLLLEFDTIRRDPRAALCAVAQFLELEEQGFPPADKVKHNAVVTPRYPYIFTLAKRTARRLHRVNASWAVNLVKRIGLERHVSRSASADAPVELPEATRRQLEDLYTDDQDRLEQMTGILLRERIDTKWS